MAKQETVEEVKVEWDIESYPFPIMYVNSVKENEVGNAWMVTTYSKYKIKIDKRKNLLYNINNERKE